MMLSTIPLNMGLSGYWLAQAVGIASPDTHWSSIAVAALIVYTAIVLLYAQWKMSRQYGPLFGIDLTPSPPARPKRPLDAKLWNERLKLVASGLNSMAASTFLVAIITPSLKHGRGPDLEGLVKGFGIALFIHFMGQAVLLLWKREV